MTLLYLACAILCEVAATLSLKGSATVPMLYAVVVLGYLAAFAFLIAVLKRGMGIGVTYGIWAAAGVALTAGLAAVIFGEAFTAVMAIGVVCIAVGVLLVETGSRSHQAGTDTAPKAR